MKLKELLFYLFFLIVLASCSERDIDDQKPKIDISLADAFPVNCDTLYFDEEFVFTTLFNDNVELGSFSFEIHHNFDHHSHSTEITDCELSPKKTPVNPYQIIQDYEIPEGLKEFKTDVKITIPSNSGSVNFDDGDYHFFVSLTDKEGWSAQKGFNVKILHK